MPQKTKAKDRRSTRAAVSRCPANSIEDLLALLSEIAYECGADISELVHMLRNVAIKLAVKRQIHSGARLSISRVSAVTGISREKISSLQTRSKPGADGFRYKNVLNRILDAWHRDRRFQDSGSPRPIKIFGRGATFESLVRENGRGLPTRAILDELLLQEKIQFLSDKIVIPNKPFKNPDGVNREYLEAVASKLKDLNEQGTSYGRGTLQRPKAIKKRLNFKRS